MLLTKSAMNEFRGPGSTLAKRQPSDSAFKMINFIFERYSASLEGSHFTFGTNPISEEEALSWKNLEALELWSNSEDLASSNEVLYRKWKTSNRVNERCQPIIPKEMKNEILYQSFDSPTSGGHFGVEKDLAGTKQIFWWPTLETSVKTNS